MIGDLFNSNKRKDVRTREDQVLFMGKKYRRDKRTGYYICTTGKKRVRLHVVVWQTHWGREVPRGCVVHHLDWDKSNNSVENLVCLTHAEHEAVHNPTPGRPGGKEWGYELVKTRGVDGCPGGML